MEYKSFGDFIARRRGDRAVTIRAMAELIDVSPGYYNDIEKSRRNPPDREKLDRLIDALRLGGEERALFFDLAGKARSEVPPDLPEYIMENDIVRAALRIAKEKAGPSDWKKFIADLERKQAAIC